MADPGRKPEWLRVRPFSGVAFDHVNRILKAHDLNTVCQAANCPNRGECFNRGTATFLILGPVCTRNCGFCDIKPGQPSAVDPDEPRRLAQVARELGLKHVVITSVTRDDLPDGGAGQFARAVQLIREYVPGASVEILTPDFAGQPEARDTILGCAPDIFNHNVETVPRLYSTVRPQADYGRSLDLLKYVAERSNIVTKSGLMVGLGESGEELLEVFSDLAHSRVSILTIGQYLAPSKQHIPIDRYYHPDEFTQLGVQARRAGIERVHASPLVRSSYKADLI